MQLFTPPEYGARNSLVQYITFRHQLVSPKPAIFCWRNCLADRQRILPPERSEEIEALRQIIVDIIDIEPGEEDNDESCITRKLVQKLEADKEQAEARKVATRARENQKREAKMHEIIHTAREGRTGKRTASFVIPQSVKDTEQKKKGKQGKILGLHEEFQKHEKIDCQVSDNMSRTFFIKLRFFVVLYRVLWWGEKLHV